MVANTNDYATLNRTCVYFVFFYWWPIAAIYNDETAIKLAVIYMYGDKSIQGFFIRGKGDNWTAIKRKWVSFMCIVNELKCGIEKVLRSICQLAIKIQISLCSFC